MSDASIQVVPTANASIQCSLITDTTQGEQQEQRYSNHTSLVENNILCVLQCSCVNSWFTVSTNAVIHTTDKRPVS